MGELFQLYGREVNIVQNTMEFVATAARWDHPFVNVVDVVISREFAMTAIRISPPAFVLNRHLNVNNVVMAPMRYWNDVNQGPMSEEDSLTRVIDFQTRPK